jgi:hypothetical protein
MRDIIACSLIISCCVGGGACVPSVPGPGKRPSAPLPAPSDPIPGDEGGASGTPGRGTSPAAAASSGGAPRADGGAADRPTDAGAPTDAGTDAAADASRAEIRPDAPAARAPRPGDVVIDELLVDPAGNDLGHEWIELANVSREPLDLSALRVADEATEAAVNAGTLAAGAILVLGQSTDRAHNGDAPVDLAYGTKLSLNNGGDRVAICAGPCATGVALDAVAWSAPWGDGYVGRAVVVEPGGERCPAQEPYGAAGNFGSPGRPNPPCPGGAAPDAGTGDADADGGDTPRGGDAADER